MEVAPAISQWLDRQFSKPRIDPEWAQQCYQWLVQEEGLSPERDFEKIKDEMTTQVHLSDLRDSMLHGTGLPIQCAAETFSATVDGPPILMQITAITDVGVSAFHLNQTRLAREERFKTGQTDDANQEGGDEEVDEGPMPKYQRGMISLQLSDGALSIQAVEYRPLPAFRLGQTKLGIKLRLKNPLIRRGIAFLEPKTVEVVGGHTDELEEQQGFEFKRGLFRRLGLADPEPDPPRAPLSDIDIPPVPPAPTSLAVNVTQTTQDQDPRNAQEERRRRIPETAPPSSSTLEARSSPRPTTSQFFSDQPRSTASLASDTGLHLSPHKRPMILHKDLGSTASPKPMRTKGKAVAVKVEVEEENSFDMEDDDFGFDDAALAELDRAEQVAMSAIPTSTATPSTQVLSQSNMTVIEIEDDDEDMEKENQPLPRPKKKGRGLLAPTPMAVVDISDSE